eukprot:TRINITY_DN15535_c0_g1_i2.p1 TRINITY_DN15535_c0_g1~~TRINITY_DN15535_c0_g1_i2.p1  ORF type:complete len:508 (-),score=-19.95 TRINITY_DN15535_c0_g1_i2:185-1708(-)
MSSDDENTSVMILNGTKLRPSKSNQTIIEEFESFPMSTKKIGKDSLPDDGDVGYIAAPTEHKRKLGTANVVFMTFFLVCGGPYGIEDAVGTGYPLFTLIGLLVMPWLWCLPMALMTAELSTMMPQNGGYILWGQRAFGNFGGFTLGFWSAINNLIDNALYPAMFFGYLAQIVPSLSEWHSVAIRLLAIFLIMCLNITGVDVVSKFSIFFAICVLGPFIVLMAWGASKVSVSALLARPPGTILDINWGLFISVLMFNLARWDNVGLVAGEVKEPAKTFPRAMILAQFLVGFSYMLPLVVCVSLDTNWGTWVAGDFPLIAEKLSSALLYVISAGGMIAGLGIFNASLCTSAQALCALGAPGIMDFPYLMQHSKRFGTPVVAVIVCAIGIASLSLLSFQALVEVDMVLYGLKLVLEFGAVVLLRFKEPDAYRPYQIPGGRIFVTIFCLPPVLIVGLAVATSSWFTKLSVLIIVVIGVAVFWLLRLRTRFNICMPRSAGHGEGQFHPIDEQ